MLNKQSAFIKNILLLCFSLLLSLAAGELVLRNIYHMRPGALISSARFHETDNLVELKGFIADSNGIMKIDPESAAYMDSIISHYNYKTVPHSHQEYLTNYEKNKICLEVYGVDHDYFDLYEPEFTNDFKEHLLKLKSAPPGALDDADSAVMQYVLTPLNAEGFRSIPFKKYKSKKKKVLLLGDSFTFGHSASNLTNSFADILLAKGYVVYNTGITFTDPAQYLGVAKKYIPMLEPDYVVVNFFMGNDIMYFHRKLMPNGPPYFYATNAAFFTDCPDGIYFSNVKEAYEFVIKNLNIPPKNLFNKFCSTFAITTLVWKAMNKHGLVDATPEGYSEYRKQTEQMKTVQPYSNIEVDSIRLIAEHYGVKFLLTPIPNVQGKKLRTPDMTTNVFKNIPYFVPKLSVSDYGEGEHYNNSGHKKHAAFLDSLMRNNVH